MCACVRACMTCVSYATALLSKSAVRDSFVDVSEMPDSDKPRYTKKDLWRVLEEKNELKLRVYELEEELEQLKRCVFVRAYVRAFVCVLVHVLHSCCRYLLCVMIRLFVA